ncbi:sigma-70 family RNA polymerase sigma factor [Planococcus liqunii]|uniref:sigma-70 family RNA polymerase sigma factor n=1 Tax=Planococcus liqunii TaxID=3058394 RepID=UPI0026257CF2|nr:sigma-70 family RNA polymerase sigma factor [Planococcus sp. N056]WKA51840.1 sigma-70 family RNA polymerase sigma factor [Planococcus sp. N056]
MENFIGRLKRRDEEALAFLIDTYMPFLKGICQHILAKSCGKQAAEECLNDVFLTIWQKSHQFEGSNEDFRKWAGMVAKYKAIDRYRRETKQQLRETLTDENVASGGRHSTEEAVLKNESREEMLVRLHQLPEADRELFLMRYYLDLSNNEIAEALGITLSAVENRLYRGKRKLGHLMERKERFI